MSGNTHECHYFRKTNFKVSEQDKEEFFNNYITQKIEEYYKKGGSNPFLKHIRVFGSECGRLNEKTVRDKMDELFEIKGLFDSNRVMNHIKTTFPFTAANIIRKEQTPNCPYQKNFEATGLMKLLVHASDSGIIDRNGDINKENLFDLMVSIFEWDWDLSYDLDKEDPKLNLFVTKNTMDIKLKEWSMRDELKGIKKRINYMFTTDKVAQGEWDDLFALFTNHYIMVIDDNDEICYEPAISIDIFLELYYQSDILFQKAVKKELPIKKEDFIVKYKEAQKHIKKYVVTQRQLSAEV
jgi:hypothetical protein